MNRISELRKKLGLTQTRLGEEIGVSSIPIIVTAIFRRRIILGAPLPPTLVMYPARLKIV